MAKKSGKFDNKQQGVSNRQLKVGEQIRHALSDIFIRGDFHNTKLTPLQRASITVSEVKIAPDLMDARAFVMPLGGMNAEQIVSELNKSAGFFRTEVTKRINLKFSPRILFRLDNSYEEANRIEKLFKNPKVAQDIVPEEKE